MLNAVLDYALLKPGTVAARYAVSANPSMVAGLAAAVLSVGSYTLAPEDTARFVARRPRTPPSPPVPRRPRPPAAIVADARAPQGAHPRHRTSRCSRASIRGHRSSSRSRSRKGLWSERADLYEHVHRAFVDAIGKPDIPINDVGMMALVMLELGFTPDEMTGLAVLSTLPGVIAHVSEELRVRAADPHRAGRPGRLRRSLRARLRRRPASPVGHGTAGEGDEPAIGRRDRGGSGIGQAIALRLRRAGGHPVHAGDISQARVERDGAGSEPAAARSAPTCSTSPTSPRSRRSSRAADEDPTATASAVFVNCAGVFDGYAGIDETSPGALAPDHRRQPDGLLPRLQGGQRRCSAPRGGGRIINIGSVAGRHGGADGLAYAASKAGIEGMTRRLAIDVGRQNITANVIAPGVISTDIRANSAEVLGDLVDVDRGIGTSSDKMDYLIPVGRAGPARRGGGDGAVPRQRRGRVRDRSGAVRRRRLGRHVVPLALPDGKRLAVSIGADFDAHCLWMGTFGMSIAGLPVAWRVRRRGRRATAARPVRRVRHTHHVVHPVAHAADVPEQCAGDRRARPRDRRPRLLPRAGAEARRRPRSGDCWRCRSPTTSSWSAAARRATARRRGTSRTPRSACSRSSGSSGTRR